MICLCDVLIYEPSMTHQVYVLRIMLTSPINLKAIMNSSGNPVVSNTLGYLKPITPYPYEEV